MNHLCNFANDRFQKHYSFPFTVFNALQRHDLSSKASVSIKNETFKSFCSDLTNIPIDAVNNTVIESKEKGNSIILPDNENKKLILRLMNQISLISSEVKGTLSSKIRIRNKIRAVIVSLGLPSFYLTVKPTDVFNSIAQIIDGTEFDLDDMKDRDIPNYWEQSCKVTQNLFLGAKFFHNYINCFVYTLLGRRTPDKMGVLGKYCGHYGTVEAQGRGSLHCHMLAWAEGSLNPQELKDKITKENDIELLAHLLAYIDDTIHMSVPLPLPIKYPYVMSTKHNPCTVRGPRNIDKSYKEKCTQDLSVLVEKCQRHKHTNTCYKYDLKECRFGLSETNNVPKTYMDLESGELTFRVSDDMINAYNLTILRGV